jgi:hypothetical protein
MGTPLNLPSSDGQTMMNLPSPNFASTPADLRLQAWLYALGDPALDRPAFELLLEHDDGTLAEAVAEAVQMSVVLKSLPTAPSSGSVLVASDWPGPSVVRRPSGDISNGSRGHFGRLGAALAVAAVMAASLLVAVLGVPSWIDQDSPAQLHPSSSVVDFELRGGHQVLEPSLDSSYPYLDSMLEVWTDFQSKHSRREVARAQSNSLADPEAWLTVQDPMADHELPEWLVLAAAASPLETTESELN